MAKTRLNKPTPKTQREISVEQHKSTYVPAGNPNYDDPNVKPINRALQTSFKGDNVKPFSIGIQDIDEAVFYYFENVIQPSVLQNGERLPVPVIYGSPEKWKSYQKDGYYRDQNGRIMAPLIMFKRDSLEKNRTIGNKLDANNPHNYSVSTKKYDPRNSYDNFKVLNNRTPERQFYATVIPDYITITYTCIAFTYYVEQLNKIVEAIEYASDAYWGDPQRYKFKAMIDSFGFQTELVNNDERIVRSTFNIKLNGYIVPEILQKDINSLKKYTDTTKVLFSIEASSIDALYTGQDNGDGTITEKETLKSLENQKRTGLIP
jgi:hypothetical protein